GLCTGAGWAAEDLFLSDSRPHKGSTDVYRVTLDETSGHGDLTLIAQVPLAESYAMACNPEGDRCYLIGKHTAFLGYLDMGNNSWTYVAPVLDGNGDIVPEIVLAAFSPDGEFFVASQLDDKIYVVDTATGMATEVGYAEENGTIIDIVGADMAFKADGHFCLWTNWAGKQAMYTLTLPSTYPGVVVATKDFDQPNTSVTGLAFRHNGYGGPIGSDTTRDEFLTMDGNFPMYLGGSPFTYWWGDMANGSMTVDVCTFTIGYYKNHSWDGATVDVCGVTVDEELGMEILSNAKAKNFSMLFAQYIAARLNVGDVGGYTVIDDAEAWLCQQENAVDGGELFWDATFYDKTQKAEANSFMGPLDEFNNSNHCD
ncbi:MAG: hypothetical protein KAJ78_05925, partial [Acidobacteria bacterium]|nr:hypothetical protein [Acidobacteriota bacterium]